MAPALSHPNRLELPCLGKVLCMSKNRGNVSPATQGQTTFLYRTCNVNLWYTVTSHSSFHRLRLHNDCHLGFFLYVIVRLSSYVCVTIVIQEWTCRLSISYPDLLVSIVLMFQHSMLECVCSPLVTPDIGVFGKSYRRSLAKF